MWANLIDPAIESRAEKPVILKFFTPLIFLLSLQITHDYSGYKLET